MPAYLYECSRCGRLIEMERTIKQHEEGRPLCFNEETGCSGDEMTTVIQPTAFVLKGPGWAKDGYGGKKK